MTMHDFMCRVVVTDYDGCWLWVGARHAKGYGHIYSNGVDVKVHRFMYVFAYGNIPVGKDVHHICLSKNCVNPRHLVAISHGLHAYLSRRKSHIIHRQLYALPRVLEFKAA